MQLLTAPIRKALLANAAHDGDHWPVVKLFAPTGAACWLFTELDGDRLFGLCDLGFGMPELGYASLTELRSVRLALGLRIERDILFEASHPLSVYTAAARSHGHITERSDDLASAAHALARHHTHSPP